MFELTTLMKAYDLEIKTEKYFLIQHIQIAYSKVLFNSAYSNCNKMSELRCVCVCVGGGGGGAVCPSLGCEGHAKVKA